MKAVEFETFISKGTIKVPEYYQKINNIKVKVILLFSENKLMGNYKKNKLLNAFDKAKKKNVFKNISDSRTWQKKLRDKWE